MIDIMSVMVAFLLVYSADVEVIQNSKGVEVPQSVAEELPKQSVVVMITKEQLFVQGELVANVEDIRERAGAADRAAARGARAADDDGRRRPPRRWTSLRARSRCWATRRLPYDVVRKVMATCTAAAYGKISLAVMRKEEPVMSRTPSRPNASRRVLKRSRVTTRRAR